MLKRTPLRRTGYIRPRPRRRPPVDWDALREAVFRRDVVAISRYWRDAFGMDELTATFDGKFTINAFGGFEACVTSVLDFDEIGKCSGNWTLNHVEDPAKPMRGRKAPDDMDHLVSLCKHHHQGSVAGRVWAARKENKRLQWEYLEEQRDADQATE